MRYATVNSMRLNDGSILAPGQLIPADYPNPNPALWVRQGYIVPVTDAGAASMAAVKQPDVAAKPAGGKKSGR